MPKRRILKIVPFVFMLFACDRWQADPRVMVNTYSSVIYSQDFLPYDEKGLAKTRFAVENDFLQEREFASTMSMGHWFYLIRFYRDKNFECFLFQYKMSELKEIEKKANVSNPVFLIGENGIRVLSRKEYEKEKTTFKPRSYDARLCKKEPNGGENKVYKSSEEYLTDMYLSGDADLVEAAEHFPFGTEEENFERMKKAGLLMQNKETGAWVLKRK